MEFQEIQAIVAEVLGLTVEEITRESTFVDDLGADELDVLQVILTVEETFDVAIPDEALSSIVTVGDLFDLLCDNI